jgi:peptidyl-prolyl cis-trans isomerase D
LENTTKKIVSLLIFGAICLVFALFGLPVSDLGGGGGGVSFVAVVNNTYIPLKDFQQEVMQMEQMYKQFFGGAGQMGAQQSFLRTQAVEKLINRELLAQESEKNHIYSTDNEVRDFIVDLPVFQDKGRFKREKYDYYLRQIGRTAGEFEAQLKKELRGQRVNELFMIAMSPTAGMVGKETELKATKLNFQFVKLLPSEIEKKEKLKKSDGEVEKWAAEHSKEIADYYAQHSFEYNKDEEVKARHILIKAEKGNKAAEEAALKKITDIAKEAKGKDFGDLAAKYSEDPGSKAKKGDLGFFGRGRMVPEFDQAAFSLPVNQISAPIKTDYGYHLIQVTEKKAKASTPLEKAKMDVARKILLKDQVAAAITEFKNLVAAKKTAEMESWLKARGINWEETGLFGLTDYSIPKLGNFDDFADVMSNLSSETPLANRLASSAGAEFLLKYKGSQKSLPDKVDDSLAKDMSRTRGQGVMSEWVNSARQTASIKTNSRIIRADGSDEG